MVGGAGYIGAHVVARLQADNEDVLVVDDFSTGEQERVANSKVLELDVTSRTSVRVLTEIIGDHGVDTVYHFAAKKQVEESVHHPVDYYLSNIDGLAKVLDATVAGGAGQFVFSSSAAVYGQPSTSTISENETASPINPYGRTKLVGEWLVRDVSRATGLSTASLRYFNVAGAASSLLADRGSTNLIPQVMRAIAQGKSPQINGTDYPTPDGTCVRDFVHVTDLADAHTHLARLLERSDSASLTVNVGTGRGFSVREVVEGALRVAGSSRQPDIGPRRPGDPASVVADTSLLESTGWRARLGLTDMLESTWTAVRNRDSD